MLVYLGKFEQIITRVLLVMMAGVVLALTLGYYLVRRSRWEKHGSNSELKK